MSEDKDKKGISSFTLRIIAYVVLALTVANKLHSLPAFEWVDYLTWFCYPIFAFLLAEGFEQTSGKFRYFVRLLLFALITEIPFNYFYGGSIFYPEAQNGMFTLCLGYLAMCAVNFVYEKTYNIILASAALYVYGWGAYYAAKILNCEFYSFGVMFILVFYVANQVTYPKLLQLVFMALLTFYVSSNAFISFIIGYMQYTIPFRAIAVPAIILTWFYKGKRGPNSIPVKVGMYLYYPVLLGIAILLSEFIL